jgi:hypothetical protein
MAPSWNSRPRSFRAAQRVGDRSIGDAKDVYVLYRISARSQGSALSAGDDECPWFCWPVDAQLTRSGSDGAMTLKLRRG